MMEKNMRETSEIVPMQHWSAEQTQEYLKSLPQGYEALLSPFAYPEVMDLHQDWHDFLNTMRKESEDGYERFGLIGYRADRKALFLPRVSLKGSERQVSVHLINAQINRTIEEEHIQGFVGDIHSHPRLPDEYGSGEIAFSSADFTSMLRPYKDPTLVIGLVEGDMNMFAFASSLTKSTSIPWEFAQDRFKHYWKHEVRLSNKQDDIEMNKSIASRHFLTLYQGVQDGEFRRI